jgi:hypothetical protein
MRWALAWTLYLLGDVVCRVMNFWDEYVGVGTFYPVYNWLMGRSSMVQGDSGNGPWEAVVKGGEDGGAQGLTDD